MQTEVSTAAATASPRHTDLGEKQACGVPGAKGRAPVEDRLPGGPLSALHADLGEKQARGVREQGCRGRHRPSRVCRAPAWYTAWPAG